MMRYLFLLLLTSFTYGQTNWETGLSIGNSNILRNDEHSFYNYKNIDYGMYIRRDKIIVKSASKPWKKYWSVEGDVTLSDYEYLWDSEKSTVFRAMVNAGLSLKVPLETMDLRVSGKFGMGYHSGYTARLEQGIVFNEGISIQTAFHQREFPMIHLGYMHISNGNLYTLNKGLEVLYIKIGWRLKTTLSNE